MRRLALIVFGLLACTAAAKDFGPVMIEPRPGVAPMREGTYYEHRFDVLNPTTDPHVIRIEIVGSSFGGGGESRAARTVVAAPRSAFIASIPQYVTFDHSASVAHIYVDGANEGELNLRAGNVAAGGYRAQRDVLFGRNVPQEFVTALAPNEQIAIPVRPQVGPSSWSPNWLHYTPFSGIVLTARDWSELPRPVQMALLRWTSAGGSLTFVGAVTSGLPPMRPAAVAHLVAGHHGFGTIYFLPDDVQIKDYASSVQGTWRSPDNERYEWFAAGGNASMPIPLLDDDSLPVKSLFSLLVAFAVIGGPINLWVLAKKQKRLWIFWTLPAIGLATALILVGALVASEGWVRIHKTTSLTLLDERIGEATTLGWTGFYATVSPEPEVRFDSGTEVRPQFARAEGRTDWTDGQRFVSGWIGSRVARGFAIRKVESRRERVPFRREGGHLVAVNGLGAEIKQLWVADEKGRVFKATGVPAGKEIVLTPTGESIHPDARDPVVFTGQPSTWGTLHKRVAHDPRAMLRPGIYVALLVRSPFVEQAVPRPTMFSSDAAVIGLIREIADAR